MYREKAIAVQDGFIEAGRGYAGQRDVPVDDAWRRERCRLNEIVDSDENVRSVFAEGKPRSKRNPVMNPVMTRLARRVPDPRRTTRARVSGIRYRFVPRRGPRGHLSPPPPREGEGKNGTRGKSTDLGV